MNPPPAATPAASTSTATSSGSTSTARPRTTPATSSSSSASATPTPAKRDFTVVQSNLVKKIRSFQIHEYYKILSIDKGVDDAEIKRAYKKLALALHPDKNGAPGADEAFKMVSKAFQVLSDSNKRSIYDQTGADPDSRAAQQQQSPFSRATARHNHGGGGGGGGFQGEELSPEDLFRFFFGQGGGGGAQFGGGGFGNGGGGFRTQFYGPGMGQQQAQQRQQQQRAGGGGAQQQGGGSIWLQVAPLLVLIAFSLLTQIPSFFSSLLGGASGVADPEFRFTPSEAYNVERTTQEGGIDYYVNPRQFSLHPIYESIVRSNPDLGWSGAAIEKGSAAYKASLLESILSTTTAKRRPAPLKRVPSALARFESKVTRSYVRELTSQCQRDLQDRSERLERSKGFLGFGADWNKVRLITAERSQVCEQLKKMGYNVQY